MAVFGIPKAHEDDPSMGRQGHHPHDDPHGGFRSESSGGDLMNRFSLRGTRPLLLVLSLASIIMAIFVVTKPGYSVSAHAPEDMVVDYDFDSWILNVTITHTTDDTNDHYVEKILIENGHARTAKAFILYRENKRHLHQDIDSLGIEDDIGLPYNTLYILKQRYLKRTETGEIVESPVGMIERVARFEG